MHYVLGVDNNAVGTAPLLGSLYIYITRRNCVSNSDSSAKLTSANFTTNSSGLLQDAGSAGQ